MRIIWPSLCGVLPFPLKGWICLPLSRDSPSSPTLWVHWPWWLGCGILVRLRRFYSSHSALWRFVILSPCMEACLHVSSPSVLRRHPCLSIWVIRSWCSVVCRGCWRTLFPWVARHGCFSDTSWHRPSPSLFLYSSIKSCTGIFLSCFSCCWEGGRGSV